MGPSIINSSDTPPVPYVSSGFVTTTTTTRINKTINKTINKNYGT